MTEQRHVVKRENVNDDWVRLYIDGKMVMEGHSLHPYLLLRLLGERFGFDVEFTDVEEETE